MPAKPQRLLGETLYTVVNCPHDFLRLLLRAKDPNTSIRCTCSRQPISGAAASVKCSQPPPRGGRPGKLQKGWGHGPQPTKASLALAQLSLLDSHFRPKVGCLLFGQFQRPVPILRRGMLSENSNGADIAGRARIVRTLLEATLEQGESL